MSIFELQHIEVIPDAFGETKEHEYVFAGQLHPDVVPYLNMRNLEFYLTSSQFKLKGAKLGEAKLFFSDKPTNKILTNSDKPIDLGSEAITLSDNRQTRILTDSPVFYLKVSMNDNHRLSTGMEEDEVYFSYKNIPNLPLGRLRLPFPPLISKKASLDTKGKVMENGHALLPKGTIVMWSGREIPEGWALCNGQVLEDGTKTPDLSEKFIKGADAEGNKIGEVKGNPDGVVRLEAKHVPAHIHDFDVSTTEDGDHTHSTEYVTANTESPWKDGSKLLTVSRNTGGNISKSTNYSGRHGHKVSGSTKSGLGRDADGNLFTLGVMGEPFEILPRYYTLAFIIKR